MMFKRFPGIDATYTTAPLTLVQSLNINVRTFVNLSNPLPHFSDLILFQFVL